MTRIHPTAIIKKGAQLDYTVHVGPYSIIGPNASIGGGTTIGAHTVVEGHTAIGEANYIGHFASIGGRPQDMKYKGEPTRLQIGDRNLICEFTTLHIGTVQDAGVTIIGDDNWIQAHVHVGHDCRLGNNVTLSNNAQLAGHVTIDDHAVVGGMSGVHQYVRIGAYSMLGDASALGQDLPPFVIATGIRPVPQGINIDGLRRGGFPPDTISALCSAYEVLYKNRLSLEEAKLQLAELAKAGEDGDEPVRVLAAFVEQSQRGIIR
jgi:UDP-N-acetylglucosamine acyltransferase